MSLVLLNRRRQAGKHSSGPGYRPNQALDVHEQPSIRGGLFSGGAGRGSGLSGDDGAEFDGDLVNVRDGVGRGRRKDLQPNR